MNDNKNDLAGKVKQTSDDYVNGKKTLNEARKEFGLNPIDDGDVLAVIQLND